MNTNADVSGIYSKRPWNKGRLVGPKAPLKLKDVWAIRTRLQLAGRTRDLALFDLAIDSKLRGCDLVRLRVGDLVHSGVVVTRATVVQRKTGMPVRFEITEQTRAAVLAWVEMAGLKAGDYLFSSRLSDSPHLSTRQYARIVKGWVTMAGLDPGEYGTHSMRRTKVTLIYRRTKNLRAIQLLLGHRKLESTVRYLGIDVEDAWSYRSKLTCDHRGGHLMAGVHLIGQLPASSSYSLYLNLCRKNPTDSMALPWQSVGSPCGEIDRPQIRPGPPA